MVPDPLDPYLRKLRDALKAGNATEHTHRPALKALVESVRSKTVATNEPTHVECGAPDFAVARRTPAGLLTVGHIETKDLDAPLAQIEKSPQLKRYLRSLPNLILTDYLDFRWYVDGELRASARLARLSGDKVVRDADGAQAVLDLLGDFLAHSPEPITRPKELAERMARLTHIIRDIIIIAFQNHRASATLCDLRTAFARTLIPDLDQPENTAQFADMYAQTIAYGLFAARCNHGSSGPFRRLGAAAEIPKTNPFLRQLFETITGVALNAEPYGGFVDDLAALLNNTNIEEVLAEFGARTRREDPVVHFYETFLATYDPKVRERRGVYYTPEPVVSYIVRSVDHILRTRFGLPDGLADTSMVSLRNAAVPAAPASGDAGVTRSAAVPAAPASGDAGVTRSAAVPAAGASGDAGGGPAFRVRDRGYLPHWELEGSTYFITFRLGDSLPESVLGELRAEREAAQAALEAEGRETTDADRRRLSFLFSQRVDEYLDAGTGACYLGRPEVGKLMADALRHFDGERYRLFAWCVMPNHVHVVCDFLGGHGLEDVLHSWKSYAAHRANRLLGRKGTFWAREYHDHIVRDEDDFYRIVGYVADNPDAAGLRDWPWVWACEDYRDVVPECNAAVSAAPASEDAGVTRSAAVPAALASEDAGVTRSAAVPAALASEDAGVTRSAAVPAALASEDAGVTVPRVLILDPACGTGTFLYAVVDHIREQFIAQGNAGMWSGYVRNHLLPRLFGFELLMAPYAVAHLKLGMQLAAQDLPPDQRATWAYDFAGDERLSIFLTNALEQTERVVQRQFHFVERIIAEEARGAQRVKRDMPIMVVLGNPPYSGHSSNRSWTTDEAGKRVPTFIGKLVRDYYSVDGEPLGERNPKYLQDDYVKFLRWAQWRIERTGAGILAFITNHGYLDNPTFRGMRQSLMKTFDEIRIMDLHGNAKKKEACPDGSKDENVFDIQQGVAICLMIKLPADTGAAE